MSKIGAWNRLRWVDSAKGLAILLVVMWHLYLFFLYPALVDYGPDGLAARVSRRMHILTPVRMPLFFLLSGALAAKLAVTSWGTVFRKRTLHYYYLYLVWVSIYSIIYFFHPNLWAEPSWLGWSMSATFKLNTLWYLWALAIFYPLAKLLSRTPRMGLVAAVLASVTIGVTPYAEVGALTDVPKNFIWFFAGFVLSESIKRFTANRRTGLIALGAAIVWIALAWMKFGSDQIMFLGIAACAVYAVLFVLVWADQKSFAISRGLAHLGKRTMPIYVLNVPVLWYLSLMMPAGWAPSGVIESFGFLLVGSALIATVSLLVGTAIGKLVPPLFSPPRWLIGERKLPEVSVEPVKPR
ncbi:surface polysaccharide O-acyltransferase-like enzyme [Mycetocola sp. BIGb0189]|uniref:acyltransferase family protein n=1 Tax=Mycetocola sp. BIGb0189 TaxID=2940604 RepID=UPI002168F950|nr:acyltransferase family protein [Mycetocola sp. BIGb0189]MCS4275351.1 surface polysaccharide O-acyltransferase-like enzyme [Mycetocola sp. BIGb0189]